MELWKLNLRLFGEGGGAAGGAAGGDGAGTGGTAGADTAGTSPAQQASAEQGAQTVRTAEERAAAFEQLIKGEYAEEFNARTQSIINTRFKDHKQLQGKLEKMQPILDALSTRYGETDQEKLMAAIEADESFYQAAADEAGMTVDQYKERQELKRKADAYDQFRANQQRVEAERQAYAVWNQQSDALKQIYPGFDFNAECANPQTGPRFIRLLGQGVDVRTAYQALHQDEIMSGAIQTAAQLSQQRTLEEIRANGMRPDENGVGGSVATKLAKFDVNNSTKKERADLAARALRGERIEL